MNATGREKLSSRPVCSPGLPGNALSARGLKRLAPVGKQFEAEYQPPFFSETFIRGFMCVFSGAYLALGGRADARGGFFTVNNACF